MFFRLDRCDKVHNNRRKQILFPIIQGGLDEGLRKKCIDAMLPFAKFGIAIGGLSGGENKEEFWKVVSFCCRELPENLPKYVMGVGWQVDMVLCALAGADMFDCVYPTRTARYDPHLFLAFKAVILTSNYSNLFLQIRNCFGFLRTCKWRAASEVESLQK